MDSSFDGVQLERPQVGVRVVLKHLQEFSAFRRGVESYVEVVEVVVGHPCPVESFPRVDFLGEVEDNGNIVSVVASLDIVEVAEYVVVLPFGTVKHQRFDETECFAVNEEVFCFQIACQFLRRVHLITARRGERL